LDDVREAGRALARAVGEAAGFVESKRPGMAATLERQGRELGKRAQVGGWIRGGRGRGREEERCACGAVEQQAQR
jgi:hypothetical protein